jgi:hypothetical protein
MARYRYADLRNFLVVQGCCTEGDAFEIGTGWYTADWMPFTLPSPVDGFVDADMVDLILADRWIGTGAPSLQRHPDAD